MSKPKPGEFSAACRLKRALRFVELDEKTRALVDADVTTPGRLKSRWDRKLEANVVDVPCAFETTDRGAFEQHTADVHGGRPGQARSIDKPGAYSSLRPEPLLGNGFRWTPLTAFEREVLGRTVEIIRHADSAVRAQIVSLADKSLIGARSTAVFAVDETGQCWIFDAGGKSSVRSTAYRISPDGRVEFQSGGGGYAELEAIAAAS